MRQHVAPLREDVMTQLLACAIFVAAASTAMAETKVVARQGVKVPIKDFKSDGEWSFLSKASDDVQIKLIENAFGLRARRRLAGDTVSR
jgi:hypothetical protein